jgi:hypothetical protein
MTYRHSIAAQRRRATREDHIDLDPAAPGFTSGREFLDAFAEAAARKQAQLAAKDRSWMAAYLRTFPDRVHSLEELTTVALERRMAGTDRESASQIEKAEQRIRAIAAEVWEQYEQGLIEAAPYIAEKRDARERAFIEAHFKAKPNQTKDELARMAVRHLVTWNDLLTEGQRPIAAERVTMIAHDVWTKGQGEKASIEEPATAATPRRHSAVPPVPPAGVIAVDEAEAGPSAAAIVLSEPAPAFHVIDERNRLISVTLREPSLAEARAELASDAGPNGEWSPLRLQEIARVCHEEYERDGKPRYHWRWRSAVVLLRSLAGGPR